MLSIVTDHLFLFITTKDIQQRISNYSKNKVKQTISLCMRTLYIYYMVNKVERIIDPILHFS